MRNDALSLSKLSGEVGERGLAGYENILLKKPFAIVGIFAVDSRGGGIIL